MSRKLILSFLALLALADWVSADSETDLMNYSYKKEVGNGQYVFIMLAVKGAPLLEPDQPPVSPSGTVYPASGLYRNNGSVAPLWTVDWYDHEEDIYVFADGQHLIRRGPWASNMSDLALAFYENGKLLQSYSIADLVEDESRLPHSVSHFKWAADISFNDSRNQLIVETYDGQRYVFEVKPGRVSKQKQ
jgi:hypothetical protein